MLRNTIIIYLFYFSIVSINALVHCPGVSDDTQEDLPWKYNVSSIVTYGTVTEVKNNLVTFKISCTIKGQLNESTIELNTLSEVANISECHYLTTNKNYIIFIEPLKATTSESKISYQLADLEEIEVTRNSVTKFIDDECNDEDDYGIPMTIFYADSKNKCDQFSVICNGKTKISIVNLNHPPLTKTSTFLGGIKEILDVPNMYHTESEMISGRNSDDTIDDMFRNTATISTIFIPTIVIITSLTMIFNQ